MRRISDDSPVLVSSNAATAERHILTSYIIPPDCRQNGSAGEAPDVSEYVLGRSVHSVRYPEMPRYKTSPEVARARDDDPTVGDFRMFVGVALQQKAFQRKSQDARVNDGSVCAHR